MLVTVFEVACCTVPVTMMHVMAVSVVVLPL